MDAEKIIELFRAVTLDILFDVHSVVDIQDDKQRTALLKAIVARLDELGLTIEQIIPVAIAEQYAGGLKEAERLIMEAAQIGEEKLKAPSKRIHMEAVDALVSDTMQDLTAAIRTAGENATKLIEDVVKQEIGKGLVTGADSRRVGAIVAEEFRNRGLTSFRTADNKELPLDFYASTVVRTKMKQANTEGAVNRYKENDVKLVQINEHHPTCHVCAARNGLVVSLGDNDEGYPTAAETGLPPFHPNCRHSIRPYMSEFKTKTEIKSDKKPFKPDKDPRSDAQKEAYQSEQQIRRVANAERKQYEAMKAVLGDQAPKTIGAFRRMKRKNDAKWKELQEKFKTSIDTTDREQAEAAKPKPKAPAKPKAPKQPKAPAPKPAAPAPEPAPIAEAKKIKEANAWAKANLNVDEVDYKGWDIRLANHTNNYMRNLQTRFPEVTTKFMATAQERNKRLYEKQIKDATDQIEAMGYDRAAAEQYAKRQIKKRSVPGNVIAQSTDESWGELEGVCFNDKFAKDFDLLSSTVARTVQTKWAPEGCEDPNSILTHEFGHQVDNLISRIPGARDYVIMEPYREWKQEAIKRMQKNPSVDWQKETVSGYGKTNDSEFFAETFREYIHNPNPRPIAADVGRRLEETLKNWRARNGSN